MKEAIKFLFLLIVLILPVSIYGQPRDIEIDAGTRTEAINEILKTIKDHYFSAEMAEKMDSGIRLRMAKKEYDSITSARVLADTLTQHLYEIGKDRHVYLRVSDNSNPALPPADMGKEGNFGISKVEILSGNIGYLKINSFPPPDLSRETIAASMKFLQNTEALIIDLRNHRGGSIDTVALMVSYFVPEQRIQLIEVDAPRYKQKSDSWTLEKVDGPRYLNKPVYVLTSQNTFSGGEEFAYDLQALKRATLVGETTRGGANPVRVFPIQNLFRLGVSFAQVKNVITGANWEGVGVKPDLPTTAEKSLETAQAEAAKKLSERNIQKSETIRNASTTATVVSDSSPLIQFPDTPVGKTLQEFLAAFNTGEREKMVEFHQKRLPNDEEGKRIANGNSNQDIQFFQESGGMTAKKVVTLSNTKVQLYAQLKNNGNWIIFTLEVSPEVPHQIVNLGVQQTKPLP